MSKQLNLPQVDSSQVVETPQVVETSAKKIKLNKTHHLVKLSIFSSTVVVLVL
jgi:hypothetical protein